MRQKPLKTLMKGGFEDMAKNAYGTNQVGTIKAPNPVKGDPKATAQTGTDLRTKRGK
jgi:hypothetical protein